jgi:anti-anti-sigma regulatory factor
MRFLIFGKNKGDKKNALSAHQLQSPKNNNSAPIKTTDNATKTTDVLTDPIKSQHETTEAIEHKESADKISHLGPRHGATVENIPAIEEAAILFASKQLEITELILQSLIQEENTQVPDSNAWLMLFDLYQIMGDQIKFEQLSSAFADKFTIGAPTWKSQPLPYSTSIDICEELNQPTRILLPTTIDGNAQQVIDAILDVAEKHNSVQLDCSQLNRIDFTACGQLLSGLTPLSNVVIEFHDVNHLVAALLIAMGFKNSAAISPRQY